MAPSDLFGKCFFKVLILGFERVLRVLCEVFNVCCCERLCILGIDQRM
jgi:hypothetical protein